MPKTGWLLYAENGVAPTCRKLTGSYVPEDDSDLVYHAEPRLTARGETIPPNGFAPCIVRIGRRILIDRGAFALWIEQRRAAPIAELNRTAA